MFYLYSVSIRAQRHIRSCFLETVWFPWWLSSKESACQWRRRRFSPWVGKIPWRRKLQCASVFLTGKSHGQRSLVNDHCFSLGLFPFLLSRTLLMHFFPSSPPESLTSFFLLDYLLILARKEALMFSLLNKQIILCPSNALSATTTFIHFCRKNFLKS